jgi:hypothetical protein
MAVFNKLWPTGQFPSDAEFSELWETLSQAMAEGHIEKVPVIKRHRYFPTEQWFRDKETGEIYSLIKPQERIRGRWAKVERERYS